MFRRFSFCFKIVMHLIYNPGNATFLLISIMEHLYNIFILQKIIFFDFRQLRGFNFLPCAEKIINNISHMNSLNFKTIT